MDKDYTQLKFHPLFDPIKKIFDFYLLGVGFISMPEFQKTFLQTHPAFAPLLNDYNKEVKLTVQGEKIKASTKLYFDYVGRLMAIATFDFLQFSEYNKLLSDTDIFRFSKHIRNGAAHNNKFFFEGKSSLKKTAKWRDKQIDVSLAGKEVMPGFIKVPEILLLVSDISELLEKTSVTTHKKSQKNPFNK